MSAQTQAHRASQSGNAADRNITPRLILHMILLDMVAAGVGRCSEKRGRQRCCSRLVSPYHRCLRR